MDLGVYAPELREIMDEAMYAPLPREKIARLPLHTRCRLIRHMTQRLLADNKIDWNNMATHALSAIGRSFDVSDYYVEWQDARAKRLLDKLKQRPYRPVLNMVRHWDHASEGQRKEVLRTTTGLHKRLFMEGVGSPVPVNHTFTEFRPRKSKGGVTVLFGTFTGDLVRRRGRIRQNTHFTAQFGDALQALDTGHHEMAHGIHFCLAVDYHHGRIRPDHPLYEDARYFHATEVRKADVPPAIPEAYEAQTFEVLASREGRTIAAGIYGLAL